MSKSDKGLASETPAEVLAVGRLEGCKEFSSLTDRIYGDVLPSAAHRRIMRRVPAEIVGGGVCCAGQHDKGAAHDRAQD